MKLELRCFRIHDKADVDDVAPALDLAFADGWQYVSHFPVGRGQILVLQRLVSDPPNGAATPKKAKEAAKA